MDPGVNIWVGFIDSKAAFEAYLEEVYEDDNRPISQFAADQDEYFYDHDFFEASYSDEPEQPDRLLAPFSGAGQFLSQIKWEKDWLPNCAFAEYDGQFDNPKSVSGEVQIVYLGRFPCDLRAIVNIEDPQLRAIEEGRLDDVQITLRPRSGLAIDEILVTARRGLVIGRVSGPDLLDLSEVVPTIAERQVEIRFSPEKERWELEDLAANGLTHYRLVPLNGETVAPFNGIRFSIGPVEFDWSVG